MQSSPRSERQIHVIAEMACSHDGNPALGRTIIDAAGAAGADAVQFQIWHLPDMMVRRHPAYPAVEKLALSREDWAGLARHVRRQWPEMAIIACVYETGSVDFAESLGVDAYKIHSADLANPELIDCVAHTGKRIDLSAGASTLDEIQAALTWIRRAGNERIWLMYGYQNFPTRLDDVHLDYLAKLRRLFELPVGYQDHTDADEPGAFWIPAAAAGMGVEVLEKHLTHDRAKQGADHEAALNPDEFARFVRMVREIEAAKGRGVPRTFSDDEEKYRVYAKKSIVASGDLPAGHVLQRGDLVFLRSPDLGLPPDRADELIGRALARPVSAQDLIRPEDVA